MLYHTTSCIAALGLFRTANSLATTEDTEEAAGAERQGQADRGSIENWARVELSQSETLHDEVVDRAELGLQSVQRLWRAACQAACCTIGLVPMSSSFVWPHGPLSPFKPSCGAVVSIKRGVRHNHRVTNDNSVAALSQTQKRSAHCGRPLRVHVVVVAATWNLFYEAAVAR